MIVSVDCIRECGSTHTNVNLVIMRNFKHPLQVYLSVADYERMTGIKHGPEHYAVVDHFCNGIGCVLTVGFDVPSAEQLVAAISNLRRDEAYKILYWGTIAPEVIEQIAQLSSVQHIRGL